MQLVAPETLAADALVVPFAMIGAPTVIVERIPGGHELDLALAEMARLLGRQVEATMPIEAGGINSTIPLVLAARTGLPVVDADGMGRAFPEVQMVTLGAGGATAWPLTLGRRGGHDRQPRRLPGQRRGRAHGPPRGGLDGRLGGHRPLRGHRLSTCGGGASRTP